MQFIRIHFMTGMIFMTERINKQGNVRNDVKIYIEFIFMQKIFDLEAKML